MTPVIRFASILLFCLFGTQAQLPAQAAAPDSKTQNAELKFVVFLSRHGVRSPTGKPDKYNAYAAAPWPEWDVPPGYLTAHGYELMKLFGAYDRARLAAEGLFAPAGCADAEQVTVIADSDQRTRETGKALAEGLFPGCTVAVQALKEGTDDPLFHPRKEGAGKEGAGQADGALAAAAIAGRIGGDAKNLTEAYRPQLAALDRLLAGCGKTPATHAARTSLFHLPAELEPGAGDHRAELRGPLATASTLSENLLLEYTEGMSGTNLGWGCLDEAALREAMQLHTAEADIAERTPAVARMYAANLLDRILKAMEQSFGGKPVMGAPGKPGDRALFLVGHDTNLATVAGALGLDWIADGRRDDTPPGSALVFELWRRGSGGEAFVRVRFTAQTLDQMRNAQNLSIENPPADVPVFVPGCSRQDMSCPWRAFATVVEGAIDLRDAEGIKAH
ncbi:MAG: histidine-type phosphatase [Terracidiphilus sp.]